MARPCAFRWWASMMALRKSACWMGSPLIPIHADLTASANVASAQALPENAGLCFLGSDERRAVRSDRGTGKAMLAAPLNPNGRPNSDVVKRRSIGRDMVQRNQDGWLIDFGEMPEAEAALYELPFEYVRRAREAFARRESRAPDESRIGGCMARSRPGLRRAIERTCSAALSRPKLRSIGFSFG